MKLKNKSNTTQNNSKHKEKKQPRVIGLGLIKLDFYININDEIIKNHNIDLEKINSPKDLFFIAENQNLLDLVQISTSDIITNILLYINKANLQKSFVELITLNPLRFKPQEEFIRKIFSHVTEHNYLFTNEMNIATAPNKISFAIKSGKRLLKYFDIVADYDPFAEEIKKEDNFIINKGLGEEKEAIRETEEERNEIDFIKNANMHSYINSSRNDNNYENFNNNEIIKDKPEDENDQSINKKNQEDFIVEENIMKDEMMDAEKDIKLEAKAEQENERESEKENNNLEKSKENSRNIDELKEKSNIDLGEEEIKNLESEKTKQNINIKEMSFIEKVKLSEVNSIAINNNQNNLFNKENTLISKTNSNQIIPSEKATNISKIISVKNQNLNASENLDISRTNQSLFKLFNIPAACEIDEYDYIFLDLDEFLNFHGTGLHLIELADFIKKIALSNKNPRIVINFPNILLNINIINLELIDIILSIMSYTDIFLFDKNECLAFFNMLSQMNNDIEITDKNLIERFQKDIPHIKNGISKIGLFLDDLQKFSVSEQRGERMIFKNDYYLNLHPKINHTNQKVIDEYRKIMLLNNNYLKSIFFGGYFSKYVFLEDHYPSFIAGIESTKRILELFKNKIDFPEDPEFYLVKLQKAKINRDLAMEELRKKEEQFVLDCVNKKTSSIKYYNPLFDDHLNSFFTGEVVRKQLKERGFINTNGFVLYDPSFKNINHPKNKKKRPDTSEKEKHLLYAIKNNKDIFSTDLESYSKSINENSPTTRRLPIPNINKDSSNLYFPNKLLKLRNAQKRTLKPLNISIKKKVIEEKVKEKETIQTKEIIEKPLNNSFKANSFSKPKPIVSNIFPTQNFHTLDKSHLNSVFEKLDTKDDKNINNISKLENSILEMSMNNKEEIAEVNQDYNKKDNNDDHNMDNIEDQIGENIELEEKENLNDENEQLNMGEKQENDVQEIAGQEMENNNNEMQIEQNENKEEEGQLN